MRKLKSHTQEQNFMNAARALWWVTPVGDWSDSINALLDKKELNAPSRYELRARNLIASLIRGDENQVLETLAGLKEMSA